MTVDPGLKPTRQTGFVNLIEPGLSVSAGFVYYSIILQAAFRVSPGLLTGCSVSAGLMFVAIRKCS